jgi:putative oxidoreductase
VETDDLLALAGRLLMAGIFLASAFGKITNFEGTVAYMDSHGVPMPVLLCAAAAAIEALGGVSLLLGFYVRWGCAALAVFLIAATWSFHHGNASTCSRIWPF